MKILSGILALLIMCSIIYSTAWAREITCDYCEEIIENEYYEIGLYKKKEGLVETCFGERMLHADCLELIDYDMLKEIFEGYVFYEKGG